MAWIQMEATIDDGGLKNLVLGRLAHIFETIDLSEVSFMNWDRTFNVGRPFPDKTLEPYSSSVINIKQRLSFAFSYEGKEFTINLEVEGEPPDPILDLNPDHFW